MMHKGLSVLAIVVGLILFTSVGGFGAQDDSAPLAFFPQTLYEFPSVLDGAQVVHEFIIQNKGKAPLDIERVKTG
jgi:hypothetical protein